jgi:hypothetical protein
MTGIEPALSAWEAGEPTSQVVFQAQTWPFGGPGWWLFRMVGARGGPEQLIKMATADSPTLPAAANGDTCETTTLGLSRPSRLGPNAASRVMASAYAAWTVNLFSQGRVI